jgi:hypothetical protein
MASSTIHVSLLQVGCSGMNRCGFGVESAMTDAMNDVRNDSEVAEAG